MIERTFHTPGPVTLELIVPTGSMVIETVDGDETSILLTADDESVLDDANVAVREHGGAYDVLVEVERKRSGLLGGIIQIDLGGRRSRIRLEVRAPHGSVLLPRSASADVTARGRYARLDAKTVSGDLVVHGEVDGEAAAKSVSGDVRLGRVGGDLRAQTVSGDVRVDEVGGSVTGKTVSGDVRVDALVDGKATFQSVSGDIDVGIRRGSRLDVDANSVSGDLSSELELADAPGGNGDGPVVVLRGKTVSGDFRVRRA
jgi:hypothetical protein